MAGWLLGFAVAAAWSVAFHRGLGTSTLLPWAAGGFGVTFALLVAVSSRDAVLRLRASREQRLDAAWFERVLRPEEPRVPGAAANASAARVAVLEARLAEEQMQLDAALRAWAEQDAALASGLSAEMTADGGGTRQRGEGSADDESALREQLVDVLADLLGQQVAIDELIAGDPAASHRAALAERTR